MLSVKLPSRAADAPALQSANYQSQLNYWTEGFAYQIDQDQAHELRTAAYRILELFTEAMNYVTSHDEVLQRFVFSNNARLNEKIRRLVKTSWPEDRRKGYILDRWDLAWDGITPIKLLERNFGHLGLIVGTGPVQEEYVQWLRKQDGYSDVSTFGSLQENVVRSFKEVAEEHIVFPGTSVGVVGYPAGKNVDPGMTQATRVLESWIARAGYQPNYFGAHEVKYFDGYVALKRYPHFETNAPSNAREENGYKLLSVEETYYPTTSSVYIFSGFDEYARTAANALNPNQYKPREQTISLQPFWTLLAGHKTMLAILYEMFEGHPNLLPTFVGTDALRGEKRIVKPVLGMQGLGTSIWGEANQQICKRSDKGRMVNSIRGPNGYVTQAYSAAVNGEGGFRVFNLFTANGHPAALGARTAPGPFVGGDDTKTRFSAVIVRRPPYRADDPATLEAGLR